MKKILLLSLFVLLPTMGMAQGTFRISAVYGAVEIRPAAGLKFAPLAASTRQMQVGDEIRTGPGSTVTMEMLDGSYVVVSENSSFTIQDSWGANVRDIMNLVAGKVRFYIQRLGGRPNPYRVQTPTALIAVRGTIFDVSVDPSDATEVRCLEGRVTVESAGMPDREVILDEGRKTLVRPGAYPIAPVDNDQALLENRVLRVVKKVPADEKAGAVPGTEILARDNDRSIRTSDPLQGPASKTSASTDRAKPTLNYPQ